MTTESQTPTTPETTRQRGGPKTEAGKARSRLNALKHGLRARTVEPVVLPHEDPAELQARIQQWIDDQQPADSVERELVERAARLSWTLDRAERHEAAILAKQIRAAMLRSKSEQTREVCDLGRKLLYLTGRRLVKNLAPTWDDDPSAFVARLEELPEGALWLLDRWRELRGLIAVGAAWGPADQFKLVRLLGKHPIEAINDPELNQIFLAWETIREGLGAKFWKVMQHNTPERDPAFGDTLAWRVLAPRPESVGAAVATIAAVVDHAIERLEDLVAALEEIEGDDALALAEEASFRASDAGERLRRHQTARTRELHRTIELLTRLKAAKAAAREKATNGPEPEFEPRRRARRPSPREGGWNQASRDREPTPHGRPSSSTGPAVARCPGAVRPTCDPTKTLEAARSTSRDPETVVSPTPFLRPSGAFPRGKQDDRLRPASRPGARAEKSVERTRPERSRQGGSSSIGRPGRGNAEGTTSWGSGATSL